MGTPTDVVERQLNTALSGDWDTLRTLYADDVQYRDPDGQFTGADRAVKHLQDQMVAFPDPGKLTIHRVYESSDGSGIAEWSATMRNTGPIHLPDGTELPATGNEVTIEVVTIYDIEDGLITSERNYWDNVALFAELGLLPE